MFLSETMMVSARVKNSGLTMRDQATALMVNAISSINPEAGRMYARNIAYKEQTARELEIVAVYHSEIRL